MAGGWEIIQTGEFGNEKFKPESCKRRNSNKICYCTHIYPPLLRPRGAARCIAVFPYTLARTHSDANIFPLFSAALYVAREIDIGRGCFSFLLRCYAIFFHSPYTFIHFHFQRKKSTLEILCMIQSHKIDFFTCFIFLVARQHKNNIIFCTIFLI